MLPPLSHALVRHFIYPIYRGLRHDRLAEIRRDAEKHQWLSSEDLETLQWRRMADFLAQITTHVPFYRDLFKEAGLDPREIRSPKDFLSIPLLAKQDIRRAGSRIITQDHSRRGFKSNTSGSTGEPLFFYCDVSAGPLRRAFSALGYRWAGIEIGDKIAYISGFHLDKPFKERLVDGVKNYFHNRAYLSSFNMSEARMQKYAGMLGAFKPDAIDGYPSAVALFAEYCKSHRITGIKPRAIFASGERGYPYQSEAIKEAFDCPLFDRYGSNEFSTTAQECEQHNGLHLLNQFLYVEVIHESGRPAGSGEIGEIVVTDLSNLYMPFLRYRTGDLAVPTARKCPCGRGSPLLDRIEGRTFDIVVTADGKSAGGYFWTYLSRFVPGIKQFQIEQRDRTGVTFRIVRGPDWKDQYTRDLERKIKENLGEEFKIRFEMVDDIPLTPAGKFRFIWSKIGERLVVKSKIHKATVTGATPEGIDCIVIDEELLELSNLAPFERVLVVDNINGARIEAFVAKGKRGSGEVVISGAGTHHISVGHEIIIMAFAWSEEPDSVFKNILVDDKNRFVRYLVEVAGEKL
jgi:phenylacetate-CoA ligase